MSHAQTAPTSRARLSGGAVSEQQMDSGSKNFGLFRKGIPTLRLDEKKNAHDFYQIMPAFNQGLLGVDTSFRTSVMPYRDAQALDPVTQQPMFTAWYAVVRACKFVGKGKEDWVSPRTRAAIPGGNFSASETADPMSDLYNHAKDHPRQDWHALTQKPQKKDEYQVISFPGTRALLNLRHLAAGGSVPEYGAVDFSTTGLEFIKQELNWLKVMDNQPTRDPKWPMFQLGDVTDPVSGLFGILTSKATMNTGSGKGGGGSATTLSFATQQGQPPRWVNAPWPLSAQDLAQRVDILDLDLVLNIPTYQAIVEYLWQDGMIPNELIREACGHAANLPGEDPISYANSVQVPANYPHTPTAPPASAYQQPVYTPQPQQPAYVPQAPASNPYLAPPTAAEDTVPGLVGRDTFSGPMPAAAPVFAPAPAAPPAFAPPPPPPAAPPPPPPPPNPLMEALFYVLTPGAAAAEPNYMTGAAVTQRPDFATVMITSADGKHFRDWQPAIKALAPPALPPPPAAAALPPPPPAQAPQQHYAPAPPQAGYAPQAPQQAYSSPPTVTHQPALPAGAANNGPLSPAELQRVTALTNLMANGGMADLSAVSEWQALQARMEQHKQTLQ